MSALVPCGKREWQWKITHKSEKHVHCLVGCYICVHVCECVYVFVCVCECVSV